MEKAMEARTEDIKESYSTLSEETWRAVSVVRGREMEKELAEDFDEWLEAVREEARQEVRLASTLAHGVAQIYKGKVTNVMLAPSLEDAREFYAEHMKGVEYQMTVLGRLPATGYLLVSVMDVSA